MGPGASYVQHLIDAGYPLVLSRASCGDLKILASTNDLVTISVSRLLLVAARRLCTSYQLSRDCFRVLSVVCVHLLTYLVEISLSRCMQSCRRFARNTPLTCGLAVGQSNFAAEKRAFVGAERTYVQEVKDAMHGRQSAVDVLVATPGRLVNHLE